MKRLFLLAVVLTSSALFAQSEVQLHARQLPGWDARSREGRCEIRVWVDNKAQVRMRGDTIFVRTLEGSKARDEGSECSQAIPYNSVRDFQVRQISGRSRVTLAQEPSRGNNFTAMIEINDAQGGGDNYSFEVSWHADADVASAPAPFFDEVRACQDVVRQRFVSQNGRGSYVDFDTFADRSGEGQDNDRNRTRDSGGYQGGNRGQETIQGHGSARRWNESRDITYSCVIDKRQNRVMSGQYQYTGSSLRTNDRSDDRRPLK